MWTASFVIAVNLFVCAIVAVPTRNDVKSFQAAVHHQDLQSILLSIEERLRNLDNIYAMHLSPTFEEKLEQYQRKLESIDTKIMRLETLVMLNLDKISENISTKNFKDDISRTNLAKKVDAVYEGISHRLNYMDRKYETSAGRMQGKLETALARLERMDESFTTRNEEIEIELSDAIAAIDDLKTGYSTMEENILNNTNENFEVSLKEQMLLMKSFNDKSNKAIATLYENTTRDFDKLKQNIATGVETINETDRFLRSLKLELKRELNEYAVKVAEMNSENWKTGTLLQNKQATLEKSINSTKMEVQNGIRTLMVLIGKMSNKDQLPQADQGQIQKLDEKMEANFEKVFSAQNVFMDNCYRLQMDESQIESKISDILEKLIETFEKKTAVELQDIKNLEKLIKSHDTQISRNLYQASTNIVTVYKQMTKDHKRFESNLTQVTDHLSALFSLIQDTLTDENGSLPSQNINSLLQDLKEAEKKITSFYKQGDALANSVDEIKRIVENLQRENSTEVINEFFTNVSQVIAGMEAKINTAYLYFYYNISRGKLPDSKLELNTSDEHSSNQINTTARNETIEKMISDIFENSNDTQSIPNRNTTRDQTIQEMINEIFGKPSDTQSVPNIETPNDCGPNLLKIIDVRNNIDCQNNGKTNPEIETAKPEEEEAGQDFASYDQVLI